ncbi:MAG: hypothetical protein BAJALOKI2v1_80067 [Promethearchaeota archaeon]|nr:MAG: hypothetical protein BAJALOKI2v1_80067 [Candidatus Lokiarchaeota archaeon]
MIKLKFKDLFRIVEFFNAFKQISKQNSEFQGELSQFPIQHSMQIFLSNPKSTIWVKFGDGTLDYGEGIIQEPDLILICSNKILYGILTNKLNALNEWEKGNIEVKGDMQYGVIFFDILKLAYEILKEEYRGENDESNIHLGASGSWF